MAQVEFNSLQTLETLRAYYVFLNIFQHYIDLDCFVIPADNFENFMSLNRAHRGASSLDPQHWHASFEERKHHLEEVFRKAIASRRPVHAHLRGFSDLVVPITVKNTVVALILAGPFADHELTSSDLRRVWSGTSGLGDAAFGTDLIYFARVLLQIPVIEGKTLTAFIRLLSLFGAVLQGSLPGDPAAKEMELLLYRVFSKSFYHFHWARRALRQDRTFQASWSGGQVSLWEQREIGIVRIPDRIVAAMPIVAMRKERDPLESLVLSASFRRLALRVAVSRSETAAGTLDDDGAILFMSTPAGSDENRSRLAARDLGAALSTAARRELGCDLALGVGARCSKEKLFQSYEGSLAALYQGLAAGRGITFQEGDREGAAGSKSRGSRELGRSSLKLAEAVCLGQPGPLTLEREQFVQVALAASGAGIAELRAHFKQGLGLAMEHAIRRELLDSASAVLLEDRVKLSLDRAAGVQDLLLGFELGCADLAGMAQGSRGASIELRLEQAKRYMEFNFYQPLTLRLVASEHGFSPATFARRFQNQTGRSFGRYLLQLRLAHARALLERGGLGVAEVGASCGFVSLSHFTHWFRRHAGATPAVYRRRHAKGPDQDAP